MCCEYHTGSYREDLNNTLQEDRTMSYPKIIQGGMGFGISGWPLARAVSIAGQLGTVTLVGADIFLARNLQKGDLFGDFRRALAHFPFPHIAKRVLKAFYVESQFPQIHATSVAVR